MPRPERLLDLLQVLRRHRRPVTGKALAEELSISLRTLYRDIASLQALGADIEGAPGLGYVLRPGFLLPPMMFSPEEIEALVLGSRWVAARTDERLGAAARDALAKIAAILPAELREDVDSSTLMVVPDQGMIPDAVDVSVLRQAIRTERKIAIDYQDADGKPSTRTIWPFAIGFFERVRLVIAWCELRQDFRSFRTDRMANLVLLDSRYPRYRQALLKEWRKINDIP